jgi:hypothetical protein
MGDPPLVLLAAFDVCGEGNDPIAGKSLPFHM